MFNFDTTFYQPLELEVSAGKMANGADLAKAITHYYDLSVKQALPIVAGNSIPFTSGKKQLMERIIRIGLEMQETKILKTNIKGLITHVKLIQRQISEGYRQIQSYTEQITAFTQELSNLNKLVIELKDAFIQEYQNTQIDIENALKDINIQQYSSFLTQREIDFLQRLGSLSFVNLITVIDDINGALFKITYNVNTVKAYAISKVRILVGNLYELALGSFNPFKIVDTLDTFLVRISDKSTLFRLLINLPDVRRMRFIIQSNISRLKSRIKQKLYDVKERLKKKFNALKDTIKARYKELTEKRGSTKLKLIKTLGVFIIQLKQQYKRIKQQYVNRIIAYTRLLKRVSRLELGIPDLYNDLKGVINMFIQNNVMSPPNAVSLEDIQIFNKFIYENRLEMLKPFVQHHIESGALSLAVFMEYVFDNKTEVDRICHKAISLYETVITIGKEIKNIQEGNFNKQIQQIIIPKKSKYSIYDFTTLINTLRFKVRLLVDKILSKITTDQRMMKKALNKNQQSISSLQDITKNGMKSITIEQTLSKMQFNQFDIKEKKRLAKKLKNIYNYILIGLKIIQNVYDVYKGVYAGQVDTVMKSLKKVIDAVFTLEKNPNPEKRKNILHSVDDLSKVVLGMQFIKSFIEEGGSEMLQANYNIDISKLKTGKIMDFMSVSSVIINTINTSSTLIYDLKKIERAVLQKNVALVDMGYKFMVGFGRIGDTNKEYDETFLKKLAKLSHFSVIDFIIRKVSKLFNKIQYKLSTFLDQNIIIPLKTRMVKLLEKWKREQSVSLKAAVDRATNIQAKVMTTFFNLSLQAYWTGATWQQPDGSTIVVTYPGIITKMLKGLVTGNLIKEISQAFESQMKSLFGVYMKMTPAGISMPPVPWNGFN